MSAHFYKIRRVSDGLYLLGSGGFHKHKTQGNAFETKGGAKCSLCHYAKVYKKWPNVYPDPGPVELVTFEAKEVASEDIT